MSRLLSGLLAALLILPAVPAPAEPEVYFSPSGGVQERLLRAILDDPAVIQRYQARFERLFSAAVPRSLRRLR